MIMNVVKYPLDIALTFSVSILVFMWNERLVSAIRPHAFSVKAHLAKFALRLCSYHYIPNIDNSDNIIRHV